MDRPPKEEKGIKSVSINDLSDDIIQLVMKSLTMYEQVVNSRISKRFNRYVTAIEITEAFRKPWTGDSDYDEEDNAAESESIALTNALKLFERFPNLTAIKDKTFWRYDSDELNCFIRKVANINHKLRYISKKLGIHLSYVLAVKEMVPNYTASHFDHVFSLKKYEEAVSRYPDLDLKFHYRIYGVTRVVRPYYNPEKVVSMDIKINSEVPVIGMLINAIRLTSLKITIIWKGNFFKLNNLLLVVSRLPLKTFTLRFNYLEDNHESYNWTRDDFYAIKQVFQIPSLDNCQIDIRQTWSGGVRDVFQAYLDFERDKVMRLNFGESLIASKPDSAFDYWIRIDNPEQFPFASFLGKYEVNDRIMQLNFKDIGEETRVQIVATCTAFAEQNPNRSFNLLFHVYYWDDDGDGYEELREEPEDSDFYKFNQDSKTVQRVGYYDL